jgi:hypothetical protein
MNTDPALQDPKPVGRHDKQIASWSAFAHCPSQFIAGLVAPTSGVYLGTDEIGAVLSGDESGPDFIPTTKSQQTKGRLSADVRYWPKADIPSCTAHVRFWG